MFLCHIRVTRTHTNQEDSVTIREVSVRIFLFILLRRSHRLPNYLLKKQTQLNMDAEFNHPTDQFSFVVLTTDVQAFQPELAESLRLLSQSRQWVIAPPALFDPESDDDEILAEETVSDASENSYPLGGYLDVYSALQGTPLPYELDQRHFEEVSDLIHMLERFSIKHGLEIEFYLGPELIGNIVCGLQDESLREGLLEEWSRTLKVKREEKEQASP